MKKYDVFIGCDYVQGHLRHGHLEGVIEANSAEEARAIALAEPDCLELFIDDYDVTDFDIDENDIEISEVEEDNHE